MQSTLKLVSYCISAANDNSVDNNEVWNTGAWPWHRWARCSRQRRCRCCGRPPRWGLRVPVTASVWRCQTGRRWRSARRRSGWGKRTARRDLCCTAARRSRPGCASASDMWSDAMIHIRRLPGCAIHSQSPVRRNMKKKPILHYVGIDSSWCHLWSALTIVRGNCKSNITCLISVLACAALTSCFNLLFYIYNQTTKRLKA